MSFLRHIRYLLLFLPPVSLVGMASCSGGEEDCIPDVNPTYTLSLRVNTGEIYTRAGTWGDDYGDMNDGTTPEGGIFNENKINTLQLFYVGDGGYLIPLEMQPDPRDSQRYICKVDMATGITVDNNTASFEGRIMALANTECMEEGDKWTVDTQSGKVTDSWIGNKIPFKMNGGVHYIPMWGIQAYENQTLKKNETTNLDEPIDMLRAESKIVIKLDDSMKGIYEIEKVSLPDESPKFEDGGFMLPGGAFSNDNDVFMLADKNTVELGREGCFNPRSSTDHKETPVFKNNSGKTEYHTYVAESETIKESPFFFTIVLAPIGQNSSNEKIEGKIYLSDYENGSVKVGGAYTKIVRNHIYEFIVKTKGHDVSVYLNDWHFWQHPEIIM